MKWLHFILSHSIFIAACAVALCFKTALLLHINLPVYFYCFIFFSTLCSYNFYWLLSVCAFATQPLKQVLIKHYSNTIIFLAAAIAMLYSMLHLLQLLPVICIAAVLTFLYSLPLFPFKILQVARGAGLLKTTLLAFTWAFVTVAVPYSQMPAANTDMVALLFCNRFLFMLLLCIIFDARDTNIDKIRGLQSLTTIVKPVTVKLLIIIIIVAYTISSIAFGFFYNQPRQIAALLATGLAAIIIYILSLKKQSYFFYYFLTDGLMLFSAIAAYMASI